MVNKMYKTVLSIYYIMNRIYAHTFQVKENQGVIQKNQHKILESESMVYFNQMHSPVVPCCEMIKCTATAQPRLQRPNYVLRLMLFVIVDGNHACYKCSLDFNRLLTCVRLLVSTCCCKSANFSNRQIQDHAEKVDALFRYFKISFPAQQCTVLRNLEFASRVDWGIVIPLNVRDYRIQ